MKKVLFFFYMFLGSQQIHATILGKASGALALSAAMMASYATNDMYKQEHNAKKLLSAESTTRPIAQKAFELSKKMEGDGYTFSTSVKTMGDCIEDFEIRHPRTIKYALLTVSLVGFGLYLIS